jgi:hypothetical protein
MSPSPEPASKTGEAPEETQHGIVTNARRERHRKNVPDAQKTKKAASEMR